MIGVIWIGTYYDRQVRLIYYTPEEQYLDRKDLKNDYEEASTLAIF